MDGCCRQTAHVRPFDIAPRRYLPLPRPAGLKAFFTTPQLDPADKIANSLALGTSPIVRALFDPEVRAALD